MSVVTAAQWSDPSHQSILATVDGIAHVNVPVDTSNQDYQAVLTWVGLGNTIATEPSSSPPVAIGSTADDSIFVFQNHTDTTKQLRLSAAGIATATTRVLAAPDANTTLVGTDAAQTLSNKTIVASANAISALSTAMFAANVIDTDTTLAANSDTRLATQKAVKAFATSLIPVTPAGLFRNQAPLDCSANPAYPAASNGYAYRVSVAGKIGGGSGPNVEVGDIALAIADNAGGSQAAVGTSWTILQGNIDGAVVGPTSATAGNIPTFSGTSGKILLDGGKALPSGALVGISDTQTLSNKTLDNTTVETIKDSNLAIVNASDVSKQVHFSLSGLPTATSITLGVPSTATTLLGHDATQTISNKTINDTNAIVVKGNSFTLEDASDITKKAVFSMSGIATATTRTYTLPDASVTLVGLTGAQTISNKTLDDTNSITVKAGSFLIEDSTDTTKKAAFLLSGISAGVTRTYTLPDANVTLASLAGAQVISNKTLDDTNAITVKANGFTLEDIADTTKKAVFSVAGNTTGTTRTYTFPDANTTLIGVVAAQTLSNKIFDDTNSATFKSNSFTLEDSADTSKKAVFSFANLSAATTRSYVWPDASMTIVGTAVTQTLSNKTLDDTNTYTVKAVNFTFEDATDTTKRAKFNFSALTTGTTRTYSFPDADTTILGTNNIQTMSGKTLIQTAQNFTLQDNIDNTKQMHFLLTPITTGTLINVTVPMGTGGGSFVMVGDTVVQTLFNKTIDGGSNTITGLANASFATMPTRTIKGNNTGGAAAPADLTVPQTQALLSVGAIAYKLTGINANSANTDNALAITLPTGVTRYIIQAMRISNASASITTATVGVFSAASGGGTAIAANQAITVSTAAANTANNFQGLTQALSAAFDFTTLYVRVGTAQGSATTFDVVVTIFPMT